MEKSSEKLIRDISPPKNPFRDLLSEVHLKLPTPIQTKKRHQRNLVLDIDPFIDRNSSKEIEEQLPCKDSAPNFGRLPNQKQKLSKIIPLNVPMKTKNSSQTEKYMKSREQLINEWILEYMQKKNHFGTHWESKFNQKKLQMLHEAFITMKQSYIDGNCTFNDFTAFYEAKKIQILTNLLKRFQISRIKYSFDIINEYYKDQLLFGLSHTIAQPRQDSNLLRLSSDHKGGVKETINADKELKGNKDISIDSQNDVLKKRASESGATSEDLSGLILNHNKLQLSGQLNHSYPNIPKSSKNNTIKNISTSKEIGQLSLQTRKKLDSTRKLIDNNQDLPLQSRKNFNEKKNHPKKPQQSLIDEMQQKKQSQNIPITVTYILKKLDLNQLTQQNIASHKNINQSIINEQNINRITFTESFYQPPMRNVFNGPNKPNMGEKRPISLEIKPVTGLFVSPQKPNFNNTPFFKNNRINEYYPEEGFYRQNSNKLKDTLPLLDNKPRAKSATPKITFTFTNNMPIIEIKKPIILPKNKPLGYEHKDFILQNSIIKPALSPGRGRQEQKQIVHKNNRLQIVSPPHNNQRLIATRLRTDQRELIKQKILPPAYDEYYTNENYHNNHHYPIKVPLLSNSNTSVSPASKISHKDIELVYNKQINQGSTAHPSVHGPPSQHGIKLSQYDRIGVNGGRTKSPREKIFVTYSNKGKI